jgi:hypothetical protein
MPNEHFKNDNDHLYQKRDGDGDPECPDCLGRGCLQRMGGNGIPGVVRCHCVLLRDILANVDRGWVRLSKAPKLKTSPLCGLENESVLITANDLDLRAHLRTAAIKKSAEKPDWFFKVVTDADLMTAWLGNIAEAGGEVFDPDVVRDIEWERGARSLVSLVLPPELLVVKMGVKIARNVAMSEVLAETILQREHLSLPSWVVDQPKNRLLEGHICWSTVVAQCTADWEVVELASEQEEDFSKDPGMTIIGGASQSSVTLDDDNFDTFNDMEATKEARTKKENKKKWQKKKKGGGAK